MTGRTTVTAARPRATGSHRPQPARRTFSPGQRALLWAAGVLGMLAIIIAILIVLNAQERRDQQQSPPPTVTTTITEPAPGALPQIESSGFRGDAIGTARRDTMGWVADPAEPRPPHLEQTLT